MLQLDGSVGEGGGQILRTALSLAVCMGTAFRMRRIRAGRARPGLRQQHLMAVRAAAEISRAEVAGARLGSQDLIFVPSRTTAGDFRFAMPTAGSTSLVLQTVMPPLMLADGPSTLLLEGGTHNPMAPTFDFLAHSFLPLIRRLGPEIQATLERAGFYPSGGGCVRVRIQPARTLQPLHLTERGRLLETSADALIAHLPLHIAERELKIVRQRLGWAHERLHIQSVATPTGPGNCLTLRLRYASVTAVFSAWGQKGVPAEQVAAGACAEARRYMDGDAPVEQHLADQLLVPLALAGGGALRTQRPTPHALTNLQVIQRFLELPFDLREHASDDWSILLGGWGKPDLPPQGRVPRDESSTPRGKGHRT